MSLSADVALVDDRCVAVLSDGRRIEAAGFSEIAAALFRAGVPADAVRCGWQQGHRMITAGKQVALRAEMRRLESEADGTPAAA